jgi:hypothetical protein
VSLLVLASGSLEPKLSIPSCEGGSTRGGPQAQVAAVAPRIAQPKNRRCMSSKRPVAAWEEYGGRERLLVEAIAELMN